MPIVAIGDNGVLQAVENSSFHSAVREAVVARVLRKDDGVEKAFEKVVLHLIGVTCAEAPSVSRSALAKGGIVILCLRNSGIESRDQKRERVHGVVEKQNELVFYFQRAEHRVLFVVRLVLVRKVNCSAFNSLPDHSKDLAERPVVVMPTDRRRRLYARRFRVLHRLDLLDGRWERRFLLHWRLLRPDGRGKKQ